MNIKETLVDSSRRLADLVVNEVGSNQEKFNELAKVMLEDEYPVSMRAARALSLCVDNHPGLVQPMVNDLVLNMEKVHTEGVKRAILKIFTSDTIQLTEDQEGILFDKCISYMISATEAIAIKAYSMDIVYNISNKYAELKQEIKEVLHVMLNDESAGIRARAGNMLKSISKEI